MEGECYVQLPGRFFSFSKTLHYQIRVPRPYFFSIHIQAQQFRTTITGRICKILNDIVLLHKYGKNTHLKNLPFSILKPHIGCVENKLPLTQTSVASSENLLLNNQECSL